MGALTVTPTSMTVVALSQEELDKCVDALKTTDYSGTQTKEIDTGRVLNNYSTTRQIEQDFGAIVFKNKKELTIYGKKDAVEKAFKKIDELKAEDTFATHTVEVPGR